MVRRREMRTSDACVTPRHGLRLRSAPCNSFSTPGSEHYVRQHYVIMAGRAERLAPAWSSWRRRPLPAMSTPKYGDAKYIFLTDFDGTITLLDSNDHMVDTVGMGYAERRKINDAIVAEKIGFRDGFRQMLESVHRPFEEMKELTRRDVKLDPGFKEFHAFAKENHIPIVVVSSGMTPIIRSIFSNLIGEEEASKLEIISNDVEFTDPEKKGDTWSIVYRHPDNVNGHDKSLSILPYRDLPQRPLLFFAGDGISDISAARHADVLFVKDKKDNDLATYCDKHNIGYHLFKDWTVPKHMIQQWLNGDLTREQLITRRA